MIQYQIISKYSLWGIETAKRKLEKAISEAVKQGWRVISVSFTDYSGVHATLERDARNN